MDVPGLLIGTRVSPCTWNVTTDMCPVVTLVIPGKVAPVSRVCLYDAVPWTHDSRLSPVPKFKTVPALQHLMFPNGQCVAVGVSPEAPPATRGDGDQAEDFSHCMFQVTNAFSPYVELAEDGQTWHSLLTAPMWHAIAKALVEKPVVEDLPLPPFDVPTSTMPRTMPAEPAVDQDGTTVMVRWEKKWGPCGRQ